MNIQTDRQRDRETDRQTERQADRHKDRETDRETERQRQTDRHKDRQTDRHNTHIYMHTHTIYDMQTMRELETTETGIQHYDNSFKHNYINL